MPMYLKCHASELPKTLQRLAILTEVEYDLRIEVRNPIRHDAAHPHSIELNDLRPDSRILIVRATVERVSASFFGEAILQRELQEIHNRLRNHLVKLLTVADDEQASIAAIDRTRPNMRVRQTATLTPLVTKMLRHAQSLDSGNGVHALKSEFHRKFGLHAPHGYAVLHDLGLLWAHPITHQTFVAQNVKVTTRELSKC